MTAKIKIIHAQDFLNLRERRLALGGTLDNAIVVDDYRILNEDGLRYEDEFVKTQDSGRHRRSVSAGPQPDRCVHRLQVRPRVQ